MNGFEVAERLQDGYFRSLGGKLLGTVALSAVLIVAVEGVRRAGKPLKRRYSSRLTEATQAGTVAVLTAGVVFGLAVVWHVTGFVEYLLRSAAISRFDAARGLLTVAVLVIAYLLVRLINRSIDRLSEEQNVISAHQSEVAYHIADVGVFALAFLAVLVVWGIDPGRLFVGAGVFGAVLGYAARGTLSAITAGFVLLFSRPFRVGDWIRIGEYEGVVREVTIVNTTIRTFDDEHVLIPNDEITNDVLVNRSRNDRLRIDVEVSVDYATDLDRVTAVATDAMEGCADPIRTVPSPQAVLKRFDDSGIVLECRFWVDDPSSRRVWETKTAVIRAIKAAFDREGISIAYPQRVLAARAETGEVGPNPERGALHPTPDGGEN